jgi:two-component system, sensor histidine kinase ChiS
MNLIKVFILTILVLGCATRKKMPKVENGLIDLRSWNFQEDGSVDLEGEWEFYWKELLESEQIKKKENHQNVTYLKVPDSWNNAIINKQKIEGRTYGTYRIRILMNPENLKIGIRNIYIATAYKIFVDNIEILQVGEVGSTIETSKPQMRLLLTEIPIKSEISLVVQVSNFHHYKGGLRRGIKIGLFKELLNERNRLTSIDLLLSGSLFIMGFYHLFTYLLRRDDKSNIYFGLFCFLIFLRILFAGEIFITTLFEDISFFFLTRIEYSSVYLGVPVFIMYLYTCYKKYFPTFIVIISLLITFPFIFLLFFGDIYYLTKSLVPFSYILIVTIVLSLIFLIYLVTKKEYAAMYLLTSGVIFGASIINDVLHNHNIINTTYTSPYGFFVVIFAQSMLISVRFTTALRESERDRDYLASKEKDLIISKMEVEKLSRTKDDFLSNLSHEIKTPLSYVYAYSELLKESNHDIDDKYYSNEIYQNAKKLNEYINDLILITEIESNIKLNKKEVNLKDMVELIINNNHIIKSKKNIEIFNNIGINELVMVDPSLFEKALSNIIKNSIIYNKINGKVIIKVSNKKDILTISISDTGIGIKRDYYSKIFEKFYRINPDYEYEGVGIGLYISEKIIQFHNGSIDLVSSPEKGTEFNINIKIDKL